MLQSGGSITSNTTNLGGNDSISAGVTLNGPATFTRAAGGRQPTTFSGAVTGTGGLTLVNNSQDDELRLTAANSYTGSTTVNGTARVRLDVDGAVPTGSALTVNGSVLFQTSSTIGSLAGGGAVFMNGNNTLTVGGDNTSTTFSGVYQDSGGSAALTKTGSGTLTLSGANTYSGGTTVNTGTLAGTTTSLQGNITNNATVTFDQTTNGTYAGVISGTGSVTKSGSGTVTLSGVNTYTGATTINAGALSVSSPANFGVGGGLVFDGGTLLFGGGFNTSKSVTLNAGGGTVDTNGNNALLQGIISGTGALTKVGAGTLVLSANNTYSGATSVTTGTLQAGAVNTLSASSAISMAAGTTLDLTGFNQTVGSLTGVGNVTLGGATLTAGGNNTSTTFSGIVSGTGGLTKSGAGTLTLSGANTYTGATTVSAGTLAGTTTSLQGNIANNATVTFDQSTDGTYAGVMSGTGALTKTGAGVVTLTGANTYTGGTTVSAGTLAGTTTSLQGAITNNATVTFDQTTNGTYAGVMSGTGALTKAGTGAVTLAGANTYSGGTTVSAYHSGAPPYDYTENMAWAGDQGLILGGLVDLMNFTNNPWADYDELLRTARSMIAGTTEYLVDQTNGILQPWTPGLGPPGGDYWDYETGIGVFMRYLLYAYQNNPDLRSDLQRPEYQRFIRTNADHVLSNLIRGEEPGDEPPADQTIVYATNGLATLVAAIVMLEPGS